MKTQHQSFALVLLLRLILGALLLSHALLGLVALGAPAFGAALAEQGMATQGLPVVLVELAGGVLVLLVSHGRTTTLPQDCRVGGSPARAFKPR